MQFFLIVLTGTVATLQGVRAVRQGPPLRWTSVPLWIALHAFAWSRHPAVLVIAMALLGIRFFAWIAELQGMPIRQQQTLLRFYVMGLFFPVALPYFWWRNRGRDSTEQEPSV